MAAPTPPPSTDDAKKIGIIIGKILIALTVLGCLAYLKLRGWQDLEEMATRDVTTASVPRTRFIPLTDEWSPVIDLGLTNPKKITWGPTKDDYGFLVCINGGEEAGGMEYEAPPIKYREKLNWTPPDLTNKIVTISFKRASNTPRKAQVGYEITTP